MNLLPVIERELRAEARHPTTYWFRPVAAGVLLLVAAHGLLFRSRVIGHGLELFTELHKFLFVTIWLLVPLMTADCVSREKREQTLGLLFLTPLKAWEILVAKTLIHGLRAAGVCAAVLPPLIIPLLLGGVGWRTVLSSVLINASSFLWALAAGLLASVRSRTVMAGFVWSMIWALFFLVILSALNGLAVEYIASFPNSVGMQVWFRHSSEWLVGVGLVTLWSTDGALELMLRTMPPAVQRLWLVSSLVILALSFAGLVLAWLMGAQRLRRTWQDLPPSQRRQRLERDFCQPVVARGFFREHMRRQIQRNPIGWLERRHWASRLAAWGWMGVLTVVYTMVFSTMTGMHQINLMMPFLIFGVAGALAVAAAASFRRERENGVMELLLTTPLSPEQIVRGRLRGIWWQFLPVILLFGSMSVLLHQRFYGSFSTDEMGMALWIAGLYYLSIPIIGLWLSLGLRHYVGALLVVIALGVISPWFFALGVMEIPDLFRPRLGISWQSTLWFYWGTPVAAGLVGMIGAWRMRESIGWVASAFVVLAILGAVFTLQPRADRPNISFGTEPQHIALLLAVPSLAIAGFAHHRLLRNLHQRKFAFQV